MLWIRRGTLGYEEEFEGEVNPKLLKKLKLYLKSDEGVAIQSTFKRLKENFNQKESRPVYIGKVRYIDYEKDVMSQSGALSPFIYKKKF